MKQKRKNLERIVILNICVLFVGIIAAFTALVIAYALPSGRVEKHVKDSLRVFQSEGDYFELNPGHASSVLDIYTDICHLQMCFIEGSDNVIDNALSSYGLEFVSDKYSPVEDLTAYFSGESVSILPRETKYWNGYVVVLKPLLLLCNYVDIRNLNILFQLFLGFYAMTLLYHRPGGVIIALHYC